MTPIAHQPLPQEDDEMASDAVIFADDEELALVEKELTGEDPLAERHSQDAAPFLLHRSRPRFSRLSRLLALFSARFSGPRAGSSSRDPHRDEPGLPATEWASKATGKPLPAPWYLWLLPSPMHSLFGYPAPEGPHRATDYLDGLRGVAALIVLFFHFLLGGMEGVIAYAYGAEDQWDWFSLPFIRTVFAGEAMVAIFFVISGYVLSARCIVAIRAGNHTTVYNALTSMAFRRAIRLFVPSIVGSTLGLAFFLSVWQPSNPDDAWPLWAFTRQWWSYVRVFLCNVWFWGDGRMRNEIPGAFKHYGPHLWSIPVEFMCSMLLFLLVIITARLTSRLRLTIVGTLAVLLLTRLQHWELALFASGMWLAEVNIIAAERSAQSTRKSAKLWSWLVVILGWYLTGFPTGENPVAPGYDFLPADWQGTPRQQVRFWVAVAAVITVTGISFNTTVQRVFTTGFARYLGKVSYALYIVHFYTHYFVRDRLWRYFNVIEPDHGIQTPITFRFACSLAIYTLFSLWVADIFYRAVDAPAVRLAKWLEGQVFV